MTALRSLTAFAVVVLASLAGCSEDGKKQAPDLATQEAVEELGLEATAQTGVIRGVVVDEAIRPLADIAVVLQGVEKTTTTTSEGVFGFEDLEPGTYFLQATGPRHAPTQQSVEVLAGVADPPLVRIMLTTLPSLAPYIEAFQVAVNVVSSAIVAGGGANTRYLAPVDIEPNGTVAQAEFVWSPNTPLADTVRAVGTAGDVDSRTVHGKSPLVLRLNVTEDGDTTDGLVYDVWASDRGDVPAGVLANQQIDVFVHVFHNFWPREDWQFGRDGEHPLPP